MSIGPDIDEVLDEIGTAFTIKRDSGDVAGGYLDITPNTQVTKPFIREFFLEVMLSYNTTILPGEVLELDTSGDRYLTVNLTPAFSRTKSRIMMELFINVMFPVNCSDHPGKLIGTMILMKELNILMWKNQIVMPC